MDKYLNLSPVHPKDTIPEVSTLVLMQLQKLKRTGERSVAPFNPSEEPRIKEGGCIPVQVLKEIRLWAIWKTKYLTQQRQQVNPFKPDVSITWLKTEGERTLEQGS